MINMTKLKTYEQIHEEKGAVKAVPTKRSGVACTDFVVKNGKKTNEPCPGEMMIFNPSYPHPEFAGLRRARCSVCGWLGWV